MDLLRTKSLITVKEARKLLGAKASSLSDLEVEDLISLLDLMATNHLLQGNDSTRVGKNG